MMHLGVHLRADQMVKFVRHLKIFVELYRTDLDDLKGKMRQGTFFPVCALIPF